MSVTDYYTAPSNRTFNNIVARAIDIWLTYDDTYGYATEKLNQIRDLPNVGGNYMYVVNMFDWENQAKLFSMVQPKAKEAIRKALEP